MMGFTKTNTGMPSLVTVRELSTRYGMRVTLRYNPRLTIIAVDPPRTSVLFHCVPGVRYLDLHTGDFGLGGGSLSCPQAQNLAMGGLHITLPMRSDAQEQILAYLREDRPIEMAYAESTHASLPAIKPKPSLSPLPPIKTKPQSPQLAD